MCFQEGTSEIKENEENGMAWRPTTKGGLQECVPSGGRNTGSNVKVIWSLKNSEDLGCTAVCLKNDWNMSLLWKRIGFMRNAIETAVRYMKSTDSRRKEDGSATRVWNGNNPDPVSGSGLLHLII